MASQQTTPAAPTKSDFLKQDSQLPGQNYFLVSFADPRDRRLEDRVRYECYRYIRDLLRSDEQVAELQMKLTESTTPADKHAAVADDFLGWIGSNGVQVRQDFLSEFGEELALRAVKVRGVFARKEDAESKARELQKQDPTFNIYLGDVGKWMPGFPDTDTRYKDMAERYQDDQLGTLIQENISAQEKSQQTFQQRQQEMVDNPVSEETVKRRKLTRAQYVKRLRELRKKH